MDLYIVLGLPHGATESDIKRAYRRLARRFHPDINPGDRTAEARFRQILEAYETLIDPRAAVALRLRAVGRGRARTRADERVRGVRLLGARRRPLGDVRRSVRRGAERARRGARPAPSAAPICIRTCSCRSRRRSPASQRAVTVTRRETCRACAGSGADAREPGPVSRAARARARCARCAGTWCSRAAARPAAAPGSSGRGRASRAAAPGRKRAPRRVQVRIPAGRRRRRAGARAGQGQCGPARRAAGRSVHHGARRAASGVPARGRRPAHGRCRSRCTRRRSARGSRSDAGRRRAAARAAGHAVGPAVPAARARRAVDARRPARRSRSSKCG